MAVLFTILGLVVIAIGVGCGAMAFWQVWVELRHDPFWPWLVQAMTWLRRAARWVLRRRPEPQTIHIDPAVETDTARPIRAIKSGLPVPEHLPLQEQIRLLVRRVEQIELEAHIDREQWKDHTKNLHKTCAEQVATLKHADTQLEAVSRSIATDTARLQVGGLTLVLVGTIVTALPTILGL